MRNVVIAEGLLAAIASSKSALTTRDARLIVKLLSERVSQLAIEKGLDDREYREAASVLAKFEEFYLD